MHNPIGALLLLVVALSRIDAQSPPSPCSLNLDLQAAPNVTVPDIPSCSAGTLAQVFDLCLTPVKDAYGISAQPGDTAAVTDAGVKNFQCLVQRFFENGQSNFTGYFNQLCKVGDFASKCLNKLYSVCNTALGNDATLTQKLSELLMRDPLANLYYMACNGPTLKDEVTTFLGSSANNLASCLPPEPRRRLYKKYDDLRNAMSKVGSTQMRSYATNIFAKKMVKGLCGAFGGINGIINIISMNKSSTCDITALRTLGFVMNSMRPAECGMIGQNKSYSSAGGQSTSDRGSSNTSFVGCFGSGHLRTFSDQDGLVTCGQHNVTGDYITLLQLPFTLVEARMRPFNDSTDVSFFAAIRVTFFDKNLGFVDAIDLPENSSSLVMATVNGRTTLKFDQFNLQQDILLIADTSDATNCFQVIDKNGRTFIRLCRYKSGVSGLVLYYLGINTLADYLDKFGSGLLRDSCPQAQDTSAFGGGSTMRRRRDTSVTAEGRVDASSTNDPNATSMASSESTMKTATATASSTYAAGNGASLIPVISHAQLCLALMTLLAMLLLGQYSR